MKVLSKKKICFLLRTDSDAVYEKLYFLKKLGSFNVCSRMLEMFYQSVAASTVYSAEGQHQCRDAARTTN